MTALQRQSAVQFDVDVAKEEVRDNWSVIFEYRDEGEGPWLVDLSHKERFDLQDGKIGERSPGGVSMPPGPGVSTYASGMLINRMNATQASIYCLGAEQPELDIDSAFTEVTENTIFLAIFGPKTFWLTEKLTSLDFLAQDKTTPFLLQGPFCHVPGQIVTLQRDAKGSGGILLTCSRGYARSMVEAILGAGAEFGLRPAGEDRFAAWLEGLVV